MSGIMHAFGPELSLSQLKSTSPTQKLAVNCKEGRLTFSQMASKLELWCVHLMANVKYLSKHITDNLRRKPQPMVTFTVGEEEVKQTFVVHKALATAR